MNRKKHNCTIITVFCACTCERPALIGLWNIATSLIKCNALYIERIPHFSFRGKLHGSPRARKAAAAVYRFPNANLIAPPRATAHRCKWKTDFNAAKQETRNRQEVELQRLDAVDRETGIKVDEINFCHVDRISSVIGHANDAIWRTNSNHSRSGMARRLWTKSISLAFVISGGGWGGIEIEIMNALVRQSKCNIIPSLIWITPPPPKNFKTEKNRFTRRTSSTVVTQGQFIELKYLWFS